MKKEFKPIPTFRNEDEERAFWAKADTSEYFDLGGGQQVLFLDLKPSTESISIRLPKHLLSQIKTLANSKDIPYQSLMKIFLADRVQEELRSFSSQQSELLKYIKKILIFDRVKERGEKLKASLLRYHLDAEFVNKEFSRALLESSQADAAVWFPPGRQEPISELSSHPGNYHAYWKVRTQLDQIVNFALSQEEGKLDSKKSYQ